MNKKCKQCGDSFSTGRSYHLFCSRLCANRHRAPEENRRRKAKRQSKPKLIVWETRTCEVCSVSFSYERRCGRKPKFCSVCVVLKYPREDPTRPRRCGRAA